MPRVPAICISKALSQIGETGVENASSSLLKIEALSQAPITEPTGNTLNRRKIMASQRSSEAFAALVTVGLLLLAAWGNALVLLVASAVALVLGWFFFRPRETRTIALAALIGGVIAAILVVVAKRLH
jgi:hypothetical protein